MSAYIKADIIIQRIGPFVTDQLSFLLVFPLSVILAVGVVLPVVSVLPVLAVVVLVQQVLWQVNVRAVKHHGVVVFFSDDFQHLRVVHRLGWRRTPGEWAVLHH